jgi:hypothetical protein
MTEVYQLDLDDDLLSHLADPESIRVLQAERLNPEVIEDEFVREAYQWTMRHLREHGKPPTASVLAEEFDLDLTDPLTAIGDLLPRLRERYIKNNARQTMEGLKEVYLGDPAGVPHYMVERGRKLLAVASPRVDVIGTGDYDRAMHLYDKRVLRGRGPSFGYKEIDDHTFGATGVTFVLGPPKSMKSWQAVKAVLGNVIEGRQVYLNSLELPPEDTDIRLRCMAADVPEWKYRRGGLSAQDKEALKEASELLDGMGVYQIVKPEPQDRTVDAMFERAYDAGADLLIIDQAQYIHTDAGRPLGEAKPQEWWGPCNRLRDLSDEMPIIVVHQFNRSTMFAEKMPEMQQAKAASAVEETASAVLGIWANKEMRKSGIVQYGLVASRHTDLLSWEIEVDLTRRCNFELLGVAPDDE